METPPEVAALGEVFSVFGPTTQGSGNVSYGIRTADGLHFVKTAGFDAPPAPGDPVPYFGHAERVALLRNAVDLSRRVRHPAVSELLEVIESSSGPLLIYDWAPGELIHVPADQRASPASPYRRLAALPAAELLDVLDMLLFAHVALERAGYVAADLYDGCLIYDWDAHRLTLIDLDTYHRGPFTNTMGRMFGSTRFMAPEEFVRGATIDTRTTVFTLGRLCRHFGTRLTEDTASFVGGPQLASVVERAVSREPSDRFATVSDFAAAWADARAAGGSEYPHAVTDSSTDLIQRARAQVPAALNTLKDLIAIRSVSSLPDHAADVRASAEAIVALLEQIGCPDVRIVVEGGQPAVIGRFPAPEGQPTICLYAHHDVQPTGDAELWTTPPFEPDERHGRLFARGSSDDKGGLAVHLAALRAFGGKPPVGVTLFIEGEEEIGSPSLAHILERHETELASDVFVIADSGNWDVGAPAFTTTLRGLADCIVEVRTLDHALHSGAFGGVVPDALTALCRLLATLHDEQGNVAVEGLHVGEAADLDYPADRLKAESGVLDGVDYIGDGSVVSRLWAKPAISVIAIDATSVANASNTLAPSARAKVSLRVAPGDDAQRALRKLTHHLETHAPWGARVTVLPGDTGEPGVVAFEGRAADAARAAWAEAWGVEPVFIGQGGSIPMIAEFQEAFPEATVLVTAVGDPDSRPHGIDESLHLGDFANAIVAETLLLAKLAH